MKVLLKEDMASLGKRGDIVEVARGYGRNYLIPYGKAVEATTKNIKTLENLKRVIELKVNKEKAQAEELAEKIQGLAITIPQRVGEGDRLYGSVTAREVAQALEKEGIRVEKKKIQMGQPIKVLGEFEVAVKLAQGVSPLLKIQVVKETV